MKTKRVLQVIGEMNCGGAEMILMNLHHNINREKVQFDYVVHTNHECFYDNEIKELGGRIFHCPKFNGKNYLLYKKWWKSFFNERNDYIAVHGHIGSSAAIYLGIARKHGIYTIAHSHATSDTKRSPKNTAWKLISFPTRYIADYYMACSLDAGIDRFGKRIVESDSFAVLRNAIDCDRFHFNSEVRRKMRKQLEVEDNFVIGNIGRFVHAKNHSFLIDVFKEFKQIRNDAKLLLLGQGPLEKTIKNKVEKMGLTKDVIFAGIHKNTEDYYMAMDCFCFPSHFEGLGMVAVEAQTSGLHTIASDAVPDLADINAGLFERVSLTDPINRWVERLVDITEKERKCDAVSFAKKSGYDIVHEAEKLQKFYLYH